MKDDKLHTAFQNWETLSSTQEEVLAYEARLKRVIDEEAALREAKLREEEAWEEGKQKGEEKGEQKGREAVVRQFLKKEMDIDSIAEVTGIEKERIIQIRNE